MRRVNCIVADRQGGSIFTGSDDGYVSQWDIRADPKMDGSAPKPVCSYFTQAGVTCMALLKRELITSSHDTALYCWRVDKLNKKHKKPVRHAPLRLVASRSFKDISRLACAGVVVFQVLCHVQFLVTVFPRGDLLSPAFTPEYVTKPINILRVITTGQIEFSVDEHLYIVLPIALGLQGFVILFVMLDIQGMIVRYLESRRRAGRGINCQVDFEFQSGIIRTGVLCLALTSMIALDPH